LQLASHCTPSLRAEKKIRRNLLRKFVSAHPGKARVNFRTFLRGEGDVEAWAAPAEGWQWAAAPRALAFALPATPHMKFENCGVHMKYTV